MSNDNPNRLEVDEQRLVAIAAELADAVEMALPAWVRRCIAVRAEAHLGALTPDQEQVMSTTAVAAQTTVGAEMRSLLAADVDQQRTNPLAVLRGAVRFPTGILERWGVPPVQRSTFEQQTHPDDIYGLVPATWADVDETLAELGLMWGAAKAHVVLARRRQEGRR